MLRLFSKPILPSCFFLVFTLLICEDTLAQSKDIARQESYFVKLYSKLTSFKPADYDSIQFYAHEFETEFTNFIKNNPATLSYSFTRLNGNNSCYIRTSEDGNFRIYSWDTWTGGSMHVFREIYQWKANGKVFTKTPHYEEGDADAFCSKVFTVSIHSKPCYFAITNVIYSTKDAMQSIAAFSIEGNQLVDTVKVFKTKTQKLNKIDVDFDFFSVVDRPERPLELINYDHKRKIIYIPLVNDKGQVTKKNLLYQLKDRYFEFIGIETGMRK
ncbi:hypothetical protein QNI19_36955 [Cytophagaceae bacterium DM2B3-1]|uniref:Uncharacterized protein n=1 Tax=Xanthocytophaga flava TaxID=3048013 RepID=A0ABT7CXU3_9BACT|nr:hypothetical protein [Xanthocytophaga flavus]MDJ1498583.1 hypothetical protein [Xanthocytophaga flavus]